MTPEGSSYLGNDNHEMISRAHFSAISFVFEIASGA
jgi:hypothetical protein